MPKRRRSSSKRRLSPGSPSTLLVDFLNIGAQIGRHCRSGLRRWWILAACIGIGSGLGYYIATSSPDVFQARSVIAVVPRVILNAPHQVKISEELHTYYETQMQYMLSSSVLQTAFEQTAAFRVGRPDLTNVVHRVNRAKQGGAIEMIVESASFEYSRQFARAWADEFLNFKNTLKGRAIDRTAAELLQEVRYYEGLLTTNQARFLEFQRVHSIASAQEVGDSARQRLDRLLNEYTYRMTQRKLLENMTREDLAHKLLEPEFIAPDGTFAGGTEVGPQRRGVGPVDPLQPFTDLRASDLRLRWQTKLAEIEQWSARLKPRHPYMIQLQEQADLLRKQLDIQLDQLEAKRVATIESLRKEETSYQALIDELKVQVFESRALQQEFDALRDEAERYRASLDSLRRQIEAINLAGRGDEQIDVLESGIGSPLPVRPNRPRIFLLATLAGLAVGIGLVLLLHNLDDRLEDVAQAERLLALPVLGQVPFVRRRRKQRNQPLFFPREENHSLFAESFRNIRSALLLGAADQPHKVILITSSVPGEGKTTVAVNLALTLAATNRRVLLLDADLRQGGTHRFFSHSSRPGLAGYLEGQFPWPHVLQPTGAASLGVIHAGRARTSPGELLLQPQAAALLLEARDQYDHVIIDSPPLVSVDDALSLASLSDGVLLVVKASATPGRLVREALGHLQLRNGHVFGIVLNQRSSRVGYGYYYDYYHRQYQTGASEPSSPSRSDDRSPSSLRYGTGPR